MQQKPENFFCTKHVLSIIGVFYITTASPFIEKTINNGVQNKDIMHFINATLISLFAAGTKAYDPYVYTPKSMPGRNKEEALDNILSEPVSTVTTIVTEDPTVNTIANVIDMNLGKSSGSSTYEQKPTGSYIRANEETWLKAELKQAVDLDDNKKLFQREGDITYIVGYEQPVDGHVRIKAGVRDWYVFEEHISLYDKDVLISFDKSFMPTKAQLEEIYGNPLTDALYSDFKTCLQTFGINTHEDICEFIAQTGHESAGLYYTREIASGDDYDDRTDLGNTPEIDGDGRLYKGAGFIQLTGKHNYQELANYLKDPRVMEGVDYVADKYPFTSAGYFWYSNQISDYINNEGAGLEQVTKIVNGGYNGLEDRRFYYNKSKQVFGLI